LFFCHGDEYSSTTAGTPSYMMNWSRESAHEARSDHRMVVWDYILILGIEPEWGLLFLAVT